MKILVIRLSSLGDVILTAPVFRALRRAYPQAYIAALAKESYADAFAANPDLSECIVLKRGESLASVIPRIRAQRFDLVVDLHANVRSRLISFFSRAPRRLRYKKAALARRLYVRWRFASKELAQHTLDRYLQTLASLNIPTPSLDPSKILVIQTAFLGDAVLTTPFLGALQERFPQAALTVLCTPDIAEVLSQHPAVSEVLVFDKRDRDRSSLALARWIKRLRQTSFPIAFIPHRSFRSAFLAWAAGIPRRIGFSSSQGRWLLTDVVPFQWGVHEADRNLALLKAVGVERPQGTLWIRPEPQGRAWVQNQLNALGVGPEARILGINAGSLWPTKRWLPEGFAAVADRVIREFGAQVIFFGSARDGDIIDRVLAHMSGTAINWVGKTSLRELIAGIARCDVFLTNDSGPLHIAVACQIPTVAIFGSTTKELGFFPYGEGHIVVEKELSCRPCGLHGRPVCPLAHFHCMQWITPEEVFHAVARQWARPHPPLSVPSAPPSPAFGGRGQGGPQGQPRVRAPSFHSAYSHTSGEDVK